MAKFTEEIYQQTLVDPSMFWKWILGEPFKLSPAQAAIQKAIGKYTETLVIAGAKGGKSVMSAGAALWGAYRLLTLPSPHKHYGLVPGSKIYIMCIAPKEDIALNMVLQYVIGYAVNSWYMSRYIENIRANELHFTDRIIIRAQGSSSRAGLGYQIPVLIMDEVCHFMDTGGTMSGTRCVNSYMPRLLPFGIDGRVVAISTPGGRHGVGYDWFKTGLPMPRDTSQDAESYRKYHPSTHYVLQKEKTHGEHPFRAVFQMPTWEMNPMYGRQHPFLLKEFKRDPWMAEREYGGKFADVVSAFFNLIQLKKCAIYQSLPQRDKANYYVIAHDPGIKKDNWALALGHLTKEEKVRVDLVRQWNPTKTTPIDVVAIEQYIVNLCERYNVVDIVADESRAISTIQRLGNLGLPSRGMSFRAMTDPRLYQNLLELVNTLGISFPPDETLMQQLTFLERITLAGRFRVQASPGSYDDLADAVAMLAYALKIEKTAGGRLII